VNNVGASEASTSHTGEVGFPTFDSIDLGTAAPASDSVDTGAALWETPEHIAVPPVFTAADLKGLDFLETYPRHPAVPAWPVRDDVREPAVDDPPVRGLLPRERSPTRSTGATWPPVRRACRSRSTSPRTAGTTPITRV